MQPRETSRLIHFDRLKERLLTAGIAPRHVRRTLDELRDHYEDAVRDEQHNGKDAVAAAQSAWARLGDEDAIAASVIAQPTLRSLPARFPKLVFGAGPVLIWAAAVAATLLLIVSGVEAARGFGLLPAPGTALDPQWLHAPFHAACFFYARILPLMIGLMLAATAIRQRMDTRWFAVGAGLIALVGGLSDIQVKFAEKIGEKGELVVSFAADNAQLATALAIAAVEFALIVTPYMLWRRRAVLA